MAKIMIKPHWDEWESLCLTQAYNQQIQLKVIANALGRTVNSVSKKVTKLGLRALSSTADRIKGKTNDLEWEEKRTNDLKKMHDILSTHAPVKLIEKTDIVINVGQSEMFSLENSDNTERVCSICQADCEYTISRPLDYIITHDHILPAEMGKKRFGDPYYVSLYDVEKWAVSEGFKRMRDRLKDEGATFWKDGRLFSRVQLLVYINQIRLERKLQPLALEEEL